MNKPVVKMISIDKIKDNPHRNFNRNPLSNEKVEELRESISETDFWTGVHGRMLKDGTVEVAFGHHRIAAAKAEGLKEVPITIEDLSDGDMLRKMAHENMDTKYGPAVVFEMVEATVKAAGEGKIKLPKLDPKTKKEYMRYAPSFMVNPSVTGPVTHAYTVESLATYLGFVKKKSGTAQDKFVAVVGALELEERKVLESKDVKNVSFEKLGAMVPVVKKRHEAIVERRTHTAEEIAELHAKRAKLDADRRKEEKRLQEQADKLAAEERSARSFEDEKKAKEAIEQLKKNHERQQMREAAYAETRKRLDAKVAEREEKERVERAAGKDLPTRYAFKTMQVKLETIVTERNPLREELKSLSRNKGGSANERELIRQALITAGDWFIDQANAFLPVKPKDVLAEARAKEEAKRALEEKEKLNESK